MCHQLPPSALLWDMHLCASLMGLALTWGRNVNSNAGQQGAHRKPDPHLLNLHIISAACKKAGDDESCSTTLSIPFRSDWGCDLVSTHSDQGRGTRRAVHIEVGTHCWTAHLQRMRHLVFRPERQHAQTSVDTFTCSGTAIHTQHSRRGKGSRHASVKSTLHPSCFLDHGTRVHH